MENFETPTKIDQDNDFNHPPEEKVSKQFNQKLQDEYFQKLRLEQNFVLGILCSLGAMIVSAILWAVITVASGIQIGYMAIGVGYLVGVTMRLTGKGIDQHFGITGAILALLGCLIGNALSIIGFFAQELEISFFDAFSMIDFSLLPVVMIDSFSIIDILFYGFALYEGYKFSFRIITEQELYDNSWK